ncbi:A24 family peptidase [Symmachiella dynata]|uniref:A24 family peptidase n=1 Tax=Symmachiella dynata TaxID=2527995 RepID=UPI0030EF2982
MSISAEPTANPVGDVAAVRSDLRGAERAAFFLVHNKSTKHTNGTRNNSGSNDVTITAQFERTICSPAGSGERRRAWQLAAAAPLVVGLGIALSQSVVAWGTALASINAAVLVLLLAVSSFTDSHWRKIPNWATYSALGWALAVNLVASATMSSEAIGASSAIVPPIGIGASLLGAAVCFATMLVVFQLAGSGAGDVKLAAALGAILGTGQGLTVILWCHIAAGVVMVGMLVWQLGPLKLLSTLLRYVGSVLLPSRIAKPGLGAQAILQRPVPLAAFFAVGTILSYFQGLTL